MSISLNKTAVSRPEAVPLQVRVAAIVPALNEEERIGHVLRAIAASELVDEVIAVSDGSSDRTAVRAREVDGVRVLELETRRGKAGAMHAGASLSSAPVLVFLDADLIGLEGRHVDAILKPVLEEQADMCIGIFSGGRFWTDLAQKIAPVISGQRALKRELFFSAPELTRLQMGVEVALTQWAEESGASVCSVVLDGVTHTMKEEKMGPLRGFYSRLVMYFDILKVLAKARLKRQRHPHPARRHAEAED